MMGAVLVIALVGITAGTVDGLNTAKPAALSPAQQTELATWLQENGQDPTSYVTNQFNDHDVVFLGEMHRIKHDVLFVQSLLEPLYEHGVRVLATEFGRREDQTDIDTLLNAKHWNETLAREITFRQFVCWGYQEYVDIYKAAWQLNRNLPASAAPFRILGINNSPDWSFIKTQADRDKGEIKRKVWGGGSEKDWAQTILEAVADGEKILVHCGIHHAFTAYRQPVVIDGRFKRFDIDLRCGNHVYNELGPRAMTVFLHSPWHGEGGYQGRMQHPGDGVIDALMAATGPRSVGFDLAGGPFGILQITNTVYRHGYKGFKLENFCDGWIYTKPISSYQGVTPIDQWIHPGNLNLAQAQSPNPKFRDTDCEGFNAAIARDATRPQRLGSYLQ